MAKWISRPTSNREIAGSSPASDLSGNLGSPNPSYEMRRVFEQLFISFAEKVVGVVCPSGQRSQTQVLMHKLREFKSHRNHETFMVRLFAPLF